MFIEDFALFLKDNITVPVNYPIQAGLLNTSQKNGIFVMSSIGGFDKRDYNGEIFFGEVQMIFRSKDIKEGWDIALSFYDFLNDPSNVYNLELPNYKLKKLQCPELPIGYPRNDADLYEHSLTCPISFIRI